MRDEDCVAFLKWALPQLDLLWAGYRKVHRTVCKRLRRRLRTLKLGHLDAYRARLEADAAEWARLDAMCRIPISRFYRDKSVFDALGETVLPALAAGAAKGIDATLRAWSIGCASGEEPYTLAMIWAFAVQPAFSDVALDILATDDEETMLRRAYAACYAEGSLKDLPPAWRERAFTRADEQYALKASLKRHVTFERADIRQTMPDGQFDLILCRNLVFTYFAPALQRETLARLATRLTAGGYLVLGKAESLPAPHAGLAALDRLPIYHRHEVGR